MAKKTKEDKIKLKPNTRYVVDFKKVIDLKDVINVLEATYFFIRTNDEGELHQRHEGLAGILKEE